MRIKRMLQTIALNMRRGSDSRGQYLKKIFYEVGDHVGYNPRVIPLYPELIKIHNNIMIASGVHFITHDYICHILNWKNESLYSEYVGCIEIMDNVFIGANSTILYNVKIGKNVIVGSNSLVNKDLESNGVYAGIPAKKICSYDEFVIKRGQNYMSVSDNQNIQENEINLAWKRFGDKHCNFDEEEEIEEKL